MQCFVVFVSKQTNSEILNKTFGKTLVKDKVVMKRKLNLHDIVFPQMFRSVSALSSDAHPFHICLCAEFVLVIQY